MGWDYSLRFLERCGLANNNCHRNSVGLSVRLSVTCWYCGPILHRFRDIGGFYAHMTPPPIPP